MLNPHLFQTKTGGNFLFLAASLAPVSVCLRLHLYPQFCLVSIYILIVCLFVAFPIFSACLLLYIFFLSPSLSSFSFSLHLYPHFLSVSIFIRRGLTIKCTKVEGPKLRVESLSCCNPIICLSLSFSLFSVSISILVFGLSPSLSPFSVFLHLHSQGW